MTDEYGLRETADKFVVYDEYGDCYHTCKTLTAAKAKAEDNIQDMYNDAGGDSGCEQVIYERKGVIIGSMVVDTEEIWDAETEETVDTVEPTPVQRLG